MQANKLRFANGGMIRAIQRQDQILVAGLAFYNNKPVGSCIITKDTIMMGYNIGVFVNSRYRGSGIGKRLLKYVVSSGQYNLHCYTLCSASRNLYKDYYPAK